MLKYFIILMAENRPCILQMFAKIVLFNGREPNIALLKLRKFSILKFYKKKSYDSNVLHDSIVH